MEEYFTIKGYSFHGCPFCGREPEIRESYEWNSVACESYNHFAAVRSKNGLGELAKYWNARSNQSREVSNGLREPPFLYCSSEPIIHKPGEDWSTTDHLIRKGEYYVGNERVTSDLCIQAYGRSDRLDHAKFTWNQRGLSTFYSAAERKEMDESKRKSDRNISLIIVAIIVVLALVVFLGLLGVDASSSR